MLTWPLETLIFLSQTAKPFFLTAISWSPGATVIDDGVLPTNFPSISISAPGGVETISTRAVTAVFATEAVESVFAG
jgi:hypothetical protein